MLKYFCRFIFLIIFFYSGYAFCDNPFISAKNVPWTASPDNNEQNFLYHKGDECSVQVRTGNVFYNGMLLQAKEKSWWTKKVQQQWIFGFLLYGNENNVEIMKKWGENQDLNSGPEIFNEKCSKYLSELPPDVQKELNKYGYGIH